MNKDKDLRLLRAKKFRENNGGVLRRVNLLRVKYMALKDVEDLMLSDGVISSDVSDSINFLQLEGYITLRYIDGKQETTLADADLKELEAILTGRGIRLLDGKITDDLVVI